MRYGFQYYCKMVNQLKERFSHSGPYTDFANWITQGPKVCRRLTSECLNN